MARMMQVASKGGKYQYFVNTDRITWMQVLQDGGTAIHFDNENTLSVQDEAQRIANFSAKASD